MKQVYSRVFYLFFLGFFLLFFGYFTERVFAATMGATVSATRVTQGDSFTLRVVINTKEKFINNAEAVITFPADLVEVTSLNTGKSIFSLWVESPNFSNASGLISFNGGVVNPGFSGVGEIFSVTFKTKKTGTASFAISGASIRENDGLGTNIFQGAGSASILIDVQEVTKPEQAVLPSIPAVSKPLPTEINKNVPEQLSTLSLSSPTHSNQNFWYNSRKVKMEWNILQNLQNLQFGVSREPGFIPTTEVSVKNSSQEIILSDDGVWYFTIRYRKNNVWSPVASYAIQVDTGIPENLSLQEDKDSERVLISLQATDGVSGVNFYEIFFDDGSMVRMGEGALGTSLTVPDTILGQQKIRVVVYDKAGNFREQIFSIVVPPLFTPRILNTLYPIVVGENVYARGVVSYSNAKIHVSLKTPGGKIETYVIETDTEGNFLFVSDPILSTGVYELSMQVLGAFDELGPRSVVHQVEVREMQITRTMKVWNFISSPLFVGGSFVVLFVAMCGGWYRYFSLKRRLLR